MPAFKLVVNPNDHQLGNANATITLVEYGDFECPFCRRAHSLIKELIKEKGNELHFIFRNFPLREIHPHAYIAAIAAEAAGKQNKFWQMHEFIFENQENLSAGFLSSLAGEIGLDLVQFENDSKGKEVEIKIAEDFESGIWNGVDRTPAFFLKRSSVLTYEEPNGSLFNAVQLESWKTLTNQNYLLKPGINEREIF